jgi:hypothetical protein
MLLNHIKKQPRWLRQGVFWKALQKNFDSGPLLSPPSSCLKTATFSFLGGDDDFHTAAKYVGDAVTL